MVSDDDWRLMGQEKYLTGATLVRRHYRAYAKNPNWDHDHCEFCSAKFTLGSDPESIHEGYATLDDYRWVCEPCFDDFKVHRTLTSLARIGGTPDPSCSPDERWCGPV